MRQSLWVLLLAALALVATGTPVLQTVMLIRVERALNTMGADNTLCWLPFGLPCMACSCRPPRPD